MEDEKEKCSIHSSLRSFTLKSILNIQKAVECVYAYCAKSTKTIYIKFAVKRENKFTC